MVLVEQDGKAIVNTASGLLRPDSDQPLSVQHRFRIASLTKGMVSMVALHLADQSALQLAAPVSQYLPELADQSLLNEALLRKPTVRDLLSHTAGFGNLGEISDPAVRAAAAEHLIEGELALMTRERFLQTLAQRPLTAQPGTAFQYGFSTDLVGLIIERITNKSLQSAMTEILFEPLGMNSTSFRVAPAEHKTMPAAFAIDQQWHDFVSTFNRADTIADEQSVAVDSLNGPMQSGGGGLVSTISDVAAYARMLANGGTTQSGRGRIVSQSLFDQAMTNQLEPTVPGAWSGVTGHTLYVQPGAGWFALMLSSNTASRVIVRLEFRRTVSKLG